MTLATDTLATPRPHHRVRTPRPATHRAADSIGGLADQGSGVIPMTATKHPDGPADDEIPRKDDALHELAEHGLRHYTAQIAAAVGSGPEAAWCEWADAPSAYIALEHRLPRYPTRDAALIWAAERGWAVAVEPGCGEDLLITASLGGDVLPPPPTVTAFARAVLAGRHTDTHHPPRAAAPDDLACRLATWAGREPRLDGRTN